MNSRELLDKEATRRLASRSNLRGAADLVFVWLQLVALFVVASWFDTWQAYVVAAVLIGSRQHALINLAHDCWHALAFTHRELNHWMGSWCYCYPVGIPYYHDRKRHLVHHRIVGHPEDPDWLNYSNENRETPVRVLGYLLRLLLGFTLFSTVYKLFSNFQPRISVSTQGQDDLPSFKTEFLRIALVNFFLLVVLGINFHWWSYFVLWFIPVVTTASFFANFRAYIEHVTEDDHNAPEERLRDIKTSPLESFFFSPAHFNYHALHHAFPFIPHYRLPEARKLLEERNQSYPFEEWDGYIHTLQQTISQMKEQEFRTRND